MSLGFLDVGTVGKPGPYIPFSVSLLCMGLFGEGVSGRMLWIHIHVELTWGSSAVCSLLLNRWDSWQTCLKTATWLMHRNMWPAWADLVPGGVTAGSLLLEEWVHFHKLFTRNTCSVCSRRVRNVLVAGSWSCFGLDALEAPIMQLVEGLSGCFLETYECLTKAVWWRAMGELPAVS